MLCSSLLLISFCAKASAWLGGYSARNQYFWIPDIYAMLPKLEEYQDNILSRCPNTKRALTDFETQQTEMLGSILEVGFGLLYYFKLC